MAICKEFVEGGEYHVYGTSTSDKGVDVINRLGAHGVKLDVTSEEECCDLFTQFKSRGVSFDVLVNNAGIANVSLFAKTKRESFDSVFDVNFHGSMRLIKECLNDMSKKRFGRIINISSVLSSMPQHGFSSYTASKSALEGITKVLALEYAKKGITVNCVNPGFVDTDLLKVIGDKGNDLKNKIPCGYAASPEDISPLVFFLASDKAKYITGECIQINGGLYFS